jgi:hypothetical protein
MQAHIGVGNDHGKQVEHTLQPWPASMESSSASTHKYQQDRKSGWVNPKDPNHPRDRVREHLLSRCDVRAELDFRCQAALHFIAAKNVDCRRESQRHVRKQAEPVGDVSLVPNAGANVATKFVVHESVETLDGVRLNVPVQFLHQAPNDVLVALDRTLAVFQAKVFALLQNKLVAF